MGTGRLDYSGKIAGELTYSNTTPIIVAAMNGHEKTVKLLIERGAEVNDRDGNGKSALYYARNRNYPKIVDILIKAGARD